MIYVHEKEVDRLQPRFLLDGFKEMINECGLIYLEFIVNAYTWEESRGIATRVHERLDRGLATQNWKDVLPLLKLR